MALSSGYVSALLLWDALYLKHIADLYIIMVYWVQERMLMTTKKQSSMLD